MGVWGKRGRIECVCVCVFFEGLGAKGLVAVSGESGNFYIPVDCIAATQGIQSSL